MTPLLVPAPQVPAQPWRNGGGQTRALLAWPAGEAWRVRISRADIDADGPFSAFPGVTRWFAVLSGAGVVLVLPDGEHVLRPGTAPLEFDGAAAPGCTLLDGPTQDLNLMLRDGTGGMQVVEPAQPWRAAMRMRGLYTTVAGRWRGGGQQCSVAAHNLLWVDHADHGAWDFTPAQDPAAPLPAWWLGYDPRD